MKKNLPLFLTPKITTLRRLFNPVKNLSIPLRTTTPLVLLSVKRVQKYHSNKYNPNIFESIFCFIFNLHYNVLNTCFLCVKLFYFSINNSFYLNYSIKRLSLVTAEALKKPKAPFDIFVGGLAGVGLYAPPSVTNCPIKFSK